MTDRDLDQRLAALFDRDAPRPDPAFVEHVVALARFDLARRNARRRAWTRIALETVGLAAVLGSFALLATIPATGPDAVAGVIPLASPAMFGVIVLALWALTFTRSDQPLRL